MHRIERLINLIAALLDSPRPMTAEEIRRRIAGYDQPTDEAFRRAFERDKESLRSMGVPIEMRSTDPFSEQMDAYTIPRHRYYLPQLDLEDDEVAALRIASEILLGPGERAGAALLKLSLDAPPSHAGTRLVWGADLAAEQPLLAVLYEAVTQGRVVGFDYTTATGAGARRLLEPYRLLHRNGHWYVVGRDRQRNAIRAFRVSRMKPKVTLSDEGFQIPEDFDAGAHLGEAWEIGEDTQPAVVRFNAGMRWWAEQNLASSPLREAGDGGLEVEMPVGNPDALISWVIGFGGAAEIVAPEVVRARLLDHLAPFLEEVER
jgi:proteasome accessory factor B